MNAHVYHFWLYIGAAYRNAKMYDAWLYCMSEADREFKSCQTEALDEMTRLHEREYHA